MSLHDARLALQWDLVMQALAAAEVPADVVDLVKNARAASDVWQGMARTLLGGADATQAKNYVQVEMHGLVLPFERMHVELVRPGGLTSHELRELLRLRLQHVRQMIADKYTHGGSRYGLFEGLIEGIDEDLAKEAP